MHLYSKFLITMNQHFFLTNSGTDVYQLLATNAADDDDLADADEDEELRETREAVLASTLEEHRQRERLNMVEERV